MAHSPTSIELGFHLYFGEVKEEVHRRKESGVSVLDLQQKWEDEGDS